MQFEISPPNQSSMFQQWFSSPQTTKSDASNIPVAHVFIDAALSIESFLYAGTCVHREMEKRGKGASFLSYLTYIVSRGSESIDFVHALKIVEIIASYSFSHRIEMNGEEQDSSYILMCELGKCFTMLKPNDVIFISTPDNTIFSSCKYNKGLTADVIQIVNQTETLLLHGDDKVALDNQGETKKEELL